ncbi:MAG: pentapeptide repeat-containing protein [Kangiellaceae bacterium]
MKPLVASLLEWKNKPSYTLFKITILVLAFFVLSNLVYYYTKYTFLSFDAWILGESTRSVTLRNIVLAIAAIFGVFLAFYRGIISYRNNVEMRKNTKIAHEAQTVTAYTKALEQLAHDNQGVRIGSIYLLSKIARDNVEAFQETVIHTLSAYLKEKVQTDFGKNKKEALDKMEEIFTTKGQKESETTAEQTNQTSTLKSVNQASEQPDNLEHNNREKDSPRPPQNDEAYAILRYLAYCRSENLELNHLDLVNTRFPSAIIKNSDLSFSVLNYSNFSNSNFTGSRFHNTICIGTNFRDSILTSPLYQPCKIY